MSSPKELIKLKEKEIEECGNCIEMKPHKCSYHEGELKALKQMDKLWIDRIDELKKEHFKVISSMPINKENYQILFAQGTVRDMINKTTEKMIEELKDLGEK